MPLGEKEKSLGYTEHDGYIWSPSGRRLAASSDNAHPEAGYGHGAATGTTGATVNAKEDSPFGGLGAWLANNGLAPKLVDPNSPGSSLDTTLADEDRARLSPLLAQLQQQASTGGGAWEGTLKDATQKAGASAMALGQSQPGVGYQSALRNIGEARGANTQRAAGQANILRNEAKTNANTQLSDLLSGQGAQDVNQAGAAAAAKQGATELNSSLGAKQREIAGGVVSGVGQGMLSILGASDGGRVPGKPEVFGDDERNDTVPAWLSPGEVVIPRSHASSPEAAADFVRALQASRRPQHLAAGGAAGNGPSVDNGGLLDTTAYGKTRADAFQNTNQLGQTAVGAGPSIVPQQLQNATDANITAAMQAGASSSGMGRAAAAGYTMAVAGGAQQDAAGKAAEAKAQEQRAGQAALIRSLLGQRATDATLAQQQQQAAFRNTQINSGADLATQAQLRNILSGVGQGLVAHGAGGSHGSSGDGGDLGDTGKSSNYDAASGAADSAWDSNDGFAHGGKVAQSVMTSIGMPTVNKRVRGDDVEVTVGEPRITERTPQSDPAAWFRQNGRPYKGEEEDDFTVERAHGGVIPEDEHRRAMDFVAALRRRRTA